MEEENEIRTTALVVIFCLMSHLMFTPLFTFLRLIFPILSSSVACFFGRFLGSNVKGLHLFLFATLLFCLIFLYRLSFFRLKNKWGLRLVVSYKVISEMKFSENLVSNSMLVPIRTYSTSAENREYSKLTLFWLRPMLQYPFVSIRIYKIRVNIILIIILIIAILAFFIYVYSFVSEWEMLSSIIPKGATSSIGCRALFYFLRKMGIPVTLAKIIVETIRYILSGENIPAVLHMNPNSDWDELGKIVLGGSFKGQASSSALDMPTSTICSSSNVEVDFFTGVDKEIEKFAESSNSTKPEEKLIGSLRYKQIDPINDSIFLSKVQERVQDIRMEMENIERELLEKKGVTSNISVISESFFTKVLSESCHSLSDESNTLKKKHKALARLLTYLKKREGPAGYRIQMDIERELEKTNGMPHPTIINENE